jgi:spore germination cell wall hydrolase CwlJ-like protein
MKQCIYIVVLSIFFTLFMGRVVDAEEKEIACLAEAVYFEARSEGLLSQLGVAVVILNRAKLNSYPSNLCDVVHQSRLWQGNPVRNKCMFSYWCDGKPERITDSDAYERSLFVAKMALNGITIELIRNATHYHARYVKPFWSTSDRFKRLGRFDTHIFYLDTKVK